MTTIIFENSLNDHNADKLSQGKRLTTLRKAKGLTTAELARLMTEVYQNQPCRDF